LEGQGQVVDSALQFSTRPALISPITLRPRPKRGSGRGPGPLPAQTDPRQLSLCGAAWTLGSLAVLGPRPGVHSLTYFETTGPLGVMETASGPADRERFPSLPGGVYPLYHVLAQVARFPRAGPTSGGGARAAALALLDPPDRRRVLVANLMPEGQTVRLEAGADRASMRTLDESCAEFAMESPEEFLARPPVPMDARLGWFELELGPYALATLDLAR
jgi:hypothetical protein